MVFLGIHSGGKGYIFMRRPNNVIFSAAHATFDESMFPRCPKAILWANTRLQDAAPHSAPCNGSKDKCHCPIPDDDNVIPSHPTTVKAKPTIQKDLEDKLKDVGVIPSQFHGMHMPPPRTSAWQDCPPTPDNIKGKQRETAPVEAGERESVQPLPRKKRQPAALPPPREKST